MTKNVNFYSGMRKSLIVRPPQDNVLFYFNT